MERKPPDAGDVAPRPEPKKKDAPQSGKQDAPNYDKQTDEGRAMPTEDLSSANDE